jgi:hypothetical protein
MFRIAGPGFIVLHPPVSARRPGLPNFSAETYPSAVERFDFLRWFAGTLCLVKSGLSSRTHAFTSF